MRVTVSEKAWAFDILRILYPEVGRLNYLRSGNAFTSMEDLLTYSLQACDV